MNRDSARRRTSRSRARANQASPTTLRRNNVAGGKPAKVSMTSAAQGRRVAHDHENVAGMSDEKIKQETGRSWQQWLRVLDAEGATKMTHGEIARTVHDKFDVREWWSQTVTVGYERLTGRRERGQRISGAYEVSKSKTFDVPVSVLFDACADDSTRRRWLDGVDTSVRTATRQKSLRLQWPDGTIVAMWFTSKGAAKSNLALAHTKLTSRVALEKTRMDWTTRLDSLQRLLSQVTQAS